MILKFNFRTSKPPETRKASAFQPIFDSAKPTESRATELTRKASIVPARIPVDKKDEK